MAFALGLDSTQRSAGAALCCSERGLLHLVERDEHASEALLACVDELLAQSGQPLESLACIAAASGPGSFTGIRTGMALAQGLAAAHPQIRLYAVPVFAAAALELFQSEPLPAARILAIPAHRDEWFVLEVGWEPRSMGAAVLRLEENPSALKTAELPAEALRIEQQAGGAARTARLAAEVLSARLLVEPRGLENFAPNYGKPVNARTLEERRMAGKA